MKALVKTAPGEGHLELLDWHEPSPEAHEVKISVAACGICGTDLHIMKGRWRCDPPVVLGHEWCGTITQVGSLVPNFRPGDRVVASNPSRTCGYCYYCVSGNPFMCPARVSAGYMIDGAFAEYLCIDARRCHALPDHVSFRQAAIGEPLSVAVHAAIERSTVHAGDLVVVSGPGCIGLLTLQIAKLEGARVVVGGLGKDRTRLDCARALGADLVVDVEQDDLAAAVQEMSGGAGADIVYECAGNPASLDACFCAVRKQGTLVALGVHGRRIEVDFDNIMMKELTCLGSYGYVWTSWQRTVRLLAEGKINVDAMISHEFPLDRFEEAFRVTQSGDAIKVLITPTADGR